jgi:hypothetical protein
VVVLLARWPVVVWVVQVDVPPTYQPKAATQVETCKIMRRLGLHCSSSRGFGHWSWGREGAGLQKLKRLKLA